MIGQTISHYKILEKLGEGGMGVVYKAEDSKLDRLVALKFLPHHLAASDLDKARFVQEAKATAALNHPNVCSIIDIQEHDAQMFIVMEFVDGQTLRERVKPAGAIHESPLPMKQAIDIGIQIADGLTAAHEKGIVHRDIKPENIMIRKDGIAQIMDFGLAKLRSAESKISRLTKQGSTVGTAGYMSPEQVQGQDADHRSDIFSYGVLLYEMLTGQLPFKGVHETALAYEIVNVDAPPMSAVKPEIDPLLDGIVLECLVKEPSERYQSVAEVAKELRRFRRESTRAQATRTMTARSIQKPGPQTTPVPHTSPSFFGRRIWQLTSIVFGLAFVVALSTILTTDVTPKIPVMRFQINLPLTTPLVGGSATVAISSDGKNIVYLAQSSGVPQLFLRPLDQIAGRLVPGTNGANDPFFSPDGEWLAYFADGKLKKASVFGGAPQDICVIPGFMRGGWWSEDNTIWFGHINSTIYRVPAGGGTPVEVTVLDTVNNEISHRFPQPLPGGKFVLFTVKPGTISSFDEAVIVAENIETHERKTLIRGGSFGRYLPTGHILFARGSQIFAVSFDLENMEVTGSPVPVIDGGMLIPQSGDANFTVSKTGTLVYVPAGSLNAFQVRLVSVDRSGNQKQLLDSLGSYGNGTFSPDGQKVAMSIRSANDDIWVYHLTRKTLTRLTFGGGNSDFPVWSPDGKRVMYVSERRRTFKLLWKAWDGSGAEEELGDAEGLDATSPPAFSPDGKFVLYCKEGDIWYMPLEKERNSKRFLQTPAFEFNPSLSPDGKWLSYCSNESGRSEVFVVPFPKQDGKWQISTNGGFFSWWLRNGKELVFFEGNTVMKVDVQTGSTFDFSTPRKLFETSYLNGFFDPAPDGKRFGLGIIESGVSFNVTQVNVVAGWFDELKQKLDNAK